MLAYVITIKGHSQSEEAAARCIESAKKYNIQVENHWAVTPKNTDIEQKLKEDGIPTTGFTEKYSRLDNCIAAFLSHYSLWQVAVELNTTVLILEHDAVFTSEFPNIVEGDITSFGSPSYGKFKQPATGYGPLVSKQYLPGAHAYTVTPVGAHMLVERAKRDAEPTDVFIHNKKFPGTIQEYYPWPVEAQDYFTTIQKETGCKAKHNWNKEYKII
jgi:GR25 family glycosyltransferase involved in LPS biosynthesis